MGEFAELAQRIDALIARAASPRPDARLLVEIEDLLAEGYMHALRGDHRSRQLQQRLDALMDGDDVASEEVMVVAREKRRVANDTRDLRSRLSAMREHWVVLGSERLGLA
jgi:hypothetical protein